MPQTRRVHASSATSAPRTLSAKRASRSTIERVRSETDYPPEAEGKRPKTRAECVSAARPCPWVSCQFHLYLEANPITGSITLNFPDLDPWEIPETCALDVADQGGVVHDEIARLLGLSRERARQLEEAAVATMKSRARGLR